MTDESIFAEALAIADPSERAAFLDRACAGNSALRRDVEALLAAHAAGNVLDRPPNGPATVFHLPARSETGLPAPSIPERLGPYKLLEKIGEGGMGEVWMAEQAAPIRRRVALKVIKPGMDSRQVLARFEAERQALALMDHPNIAKVHDAGAAPDGRPFFVMELVKGVPITKYCDEHHLTPRQRLELFIPVCQAIQHAHQKGIIHRDIKPSNVLVAMYDDRPVPKVIDFGIAKATGVQLTEATLHTGFGAVVGTVEYMSPEQASFNQLDVDTRSDIYSLGVLLYELLAGSPPFSTKELEKAGMLEILRIIREQDPVKPSVKLSSAEGLPTLSANRGTEPKRLLSLLKSEIDWIVMKALEKDRNRRYDSANGFAIDVQRYLAGEQVQAVPPSAWYRLRKFVRRNRGVLSAMAACILILLAATAVSLQFAFWADKERDNAVAARNDENAARKRAEQERSLSTTYAVRWILDQAESREGSPDGLLWTARALEVVTREQPVLESFIRRALVLRGHHHSLPDPFLYGGPLEGARVDHPVLAMHPNGQLALVLFRKDACGALFNLADKKLTPLQHPDPSRVIVAGVFSPSGKYVLTSVAINPGQLADAHNFQLELWESAGGKRVGMVGDGRFDPEASFFSSDEKRLLAFRLATGAQGRSTHLAVFEADSLTPLFEIRPPQGVATACLHPEGNSIWTFGGDYTLRRWRFDDGKDLGQPWVFADKTSAAFSPDGKRLLGVGPGHHVRIFDLAKRTLIGMSHERSIAEDDGVSLRFTGTRALVITKERTDNTQPWHFHVDYFDFAAGSKYEIKPAPVLLQHSIRFDTHQRFAIVYEPTPLLHPWGGGGGMGMGGGAGGGMIVDLAAARVLGYAGGAGNPTWAPDGQTFFDGLSRYSVREFPGDAKAARLWAEVFTFHELTSNDALRLLDEAEWEQRRSILQEWSSKQPLLPEWSAHIIRDQSRWVRWRLDKTHGDMRARLALFDRLLVFDPSAENYAGRASCHFQLRNYRAAIADLDVSLAKEPSADPDSNYPRFGYFQRSHAHAQLKHWKEAISDLLEYRKLSGRNKIVEEPSAFGSNTALATLVQLTLLYLQVNDRASYRACCKEARENVARLANPFADQLDVVLWMHCWLPGEPEDVEVLRTLAEKRKKKSRDGNVGLTSGIEAFLYRTEQHQALAEWTQRKDRDYNNWRELEAELWRAMACLKLGRRADADKALLEFDARKKWLEKVDNADDPPFEWGWEQQYIWQALRQEIAALLK